MSLNCRDAKLSLDIPNDDDYHSRIISVGEDDQVIKPLSPLLKGFNNFKYHKSTNLLINFNYDLLSIQEWN